MIRIGVISAYPEEDWDARAILDAARAAGRVDLLSPIDFGARLERGRATVTIAGADARSWDLVLTPRALGDDGDPELQVELYRALAELGVPLVNQVSALTVAVDKFRSSWLLSRAGIPTPDVIVAQARGTASAALAELGDAVAKPLYGSLGIGVERLGPHDAPRLAARLADERAVYLQRYLPDAEDLRAFVVGDRVEGAIVRRARAGALSANIHQGGSFAEARLDRFTEELAVRAACTLGLDYAGVDLLVTAGGPQVIEVNGTPSFRGVNQATGRDMAQAIVAHALKRAEERREDDGGRAARSR
jgi:ribosomal protein S6--L-glutamate ligase